MSARDRVEYLSYRLGARLMRALPLRGSQALGAMSASLALRLSRRYGQPALQNLRLVFPEMSEAERHRIARESFTHTAWNLIDFARAEAWDAEEMRRHVDLVGLEHLEKALESGNGAFALTLHLGNFELGIRRLSLVGDLQCVAVGRPMRNQRIYARVRRARTRFGAELVDRDDAARQMLRALRTNKVVAVLNDHYAHRPRGIFVPFFGLRALTSPGVAMLSRRTDAPVLPSYVVRDGRDHHTLHLESPLERIDTGDRTRDIEAATAAQNAALEAIIRRYPEQWMWGSRRFRRSPDLAGPPYPRRRRRSRPPPPPTTIERVE